MFCNLFSNNRQPKKVFMLLSILILLLVNFGIASAQAATAPSTEWEKIFDVSHRGAGDSMQRTDDGGYIITGITNYQ